MESYMCVMNFVISLKGDLIFHSEQATALDGCSGLLGPYEDQTFKALIPARHPTDYKEFARQIRARTQQRIMEAVESFLQEDQSFSDSDASIDEELCEK